MGLDNDQFVHPERISSQLICPICTQVLDNPVQTPTDHLFCEDELLEWLSRSTMCPATNTPLDPDSILTKLSKTSVSEMQKETNYTTSNNSSTETVVSSNAEMIDLMKMFVEKMDDFIDAQSDSNSIQSELLQYSKV